MITSTIIVLYKHVVTSTYTILMRQFTVSLTCRQRENVLFIGTCVPPIRFVLCPLLTRGWVRTAPSHCKQKTLLLVSEVHNSTATLAHWHPLLRSCGSQHSPFQSGGAQCVNAVVVAATVTTLTTKIVQAVIPDSNTGVATYC